MNGGCRCCSAVRSLAQSAYGLVTPQSGVTRAVSGMSAEAGSAKTTGDIVLCQPVTGIGENPVGTPHFY